MKLRTKAFLFLWIVAIISVSSIVFYVKNIVGGVFKKQTTENFRIIVEQTESSYFAFLEKMKARTLDWTSDPILQGIVKAMVVAKDGTPERARLAKEFAVYVSEKKMPFDPSVMMVDILDQSGLVIASTRPDRIGTDELGEEVRLKAHHFSKTIVSNFGEAFVKSIIFEEDETSEPMIHATVRFFIPNKEGGRDPLDAVLLVHFLSISQISEVVSGQTATQRILPSGQIERKTNKAISSSYKTSDVYMVNSARIMVTPSRYVPDIKLQQKVDTLPVNECLEQGREINEEYDNYRGSRVLGASMCLEQDGLVLIMEVEKKEIMAPFTKLVRWTIVGGLTVTLLGMFIVVLFIRRPLSRIDEIVAVFERIMKRDFTARAKVHTKDEMGYLATMLNKMAEMIQSDQEALQFSKRELEENVVVLKKSIKEHEEQEKFIEQSEKATRNLLEDAWQTKEKFEVEKNHLQTIISSIGDGLIIIDKQYNIILVNPKAVELLQIPSLGNILGKDLRTIIKLWKKRKTELLPGAWPIDKMFLTKKIVVADLEDEISITTNSRPTELPIVLSAAPLGGENGGAVIIIRDSTEDRELDDAKSGFISVASHQLRTPLTTIRWYSEMLLSGDAGALNESQHDFLSEIHGGAERLYQTVDLLLGISRVESGKLKVEKKEVDLTMFTAEVTKELAQLIDQKKLALSVVPPQGVPVVVVLDPLMLRQVVLNLISNAIRYTNEGGTIDVQWNIDNGLGAHVTYIIRDNGIGIPNAQHERVFSKFFRADNALSKVPDGSGLGLALVKELVESWGGKVWFETKEGQGTTFFFTVPLTTPVDLVPNVAENTEHVNAPEVRP